jgi:hypothetical protein
MKIPGEIETMGSTGVSKWEARYFAYSSIASSGNPGACTMSSVSCNWPRKCRLDLDWPICFQFPHATNLKEE